MIKILIIGAGQIGSRHLQSLAKFDNPATIDVLDPSENSRILAQSRFDEIENNSKTIELRLFDAMQKIDSYYDVALITTDSLPRLQIIKNLVQHTKIKYLILEKFLFPRLEDYKTATDLLAQHQILAFVNTPRRQYEHYQKFAEIFKNSENIHFRVSGSNWGLACNSIHFLDLFALISNSTNIVLDSQLIDNEVISSKRNGYVEFSGTIRGYDDRQNSIEISAYKNGNAPIQIEISNDSHRVIIDEKNCEIIQSEAATNWTTERENFRPKYQSELTLLAVKDLIEHGSCQLPTYEASSKLHLLLLNLFLEILNTNSSQKIDICPIT